ncbi:MAG: hypothetical protein ABSB60_18165 [Terracidiphilus sp.]|jgi:hypothetical protein
MSVEKRFFVHPERFSAAAGIFVALFVIWQLFVSDAVQSIWWHRTHGNKVEFQGRKMTLPLMWRQDPSGSDAVLKLSRAEFWHPALPLLNGTESLTIMLGADGPRVIDDAGASRWQADSVAIRSSQDYPSPENLHAKCITFYCFDRNDGDIHGGCFVCEATGTNWNVIFAAGQTDPGAIQEQMQEARKILESVE